MPNNLEKNLNATIVLILCGVILSAFGVQFIWNEQPCPLCLLQRIGMLAAATGLLLNIWFGIQTSHYAISLLASLAGGFVALRQISLHICPGFPEFGIPVLGLSLYTWSFVVFVCVVLAIALLLFLYDPKRNTQAVPLNFYCGFAFGLAVFVTLANIITTFLQCGFGPCAD